MLEIALVVVGIRIAWKVYKGYTNSKEELRLQLMIDAAERRGNDALVDELRRAKPLISSNAQLYVRTLAAIEDRVAMAAQAPPQPAQSSVTYLRRTSGDVDVDGADEAIERAHEHREKAFAALEAGDQKEACAGMLRAFVPGAVAAAVWLRELQIVVADQTRVEGASPESVNLFLRQLFIGTSKAVAALGESYLVASTAAAMLGSSTPPAKLHDAPEVRAIAAEEIGRGGPDALGRQVGILLRLTDGLVDLMSPAVAGLTGETIPADEMCDRLTSVADVLGPSLRKLLVARHVFEQLGAALPAL